MLVIHLTAEALPYLGTKCFVQGHSGDRRA